MTRPAALRPALIATLVATLVSAAIMGSPTLANAQEPSPATEKGAFCIDIARIDRTLVIDNRTILVEMKGRQDFRKITLANRCPGLRISGGFAYDTRLPKLCRTEIIQPAGDPVPASCAIDAILAITPEEAAILKARG